MRHGLLIVLLLFSLLNASAQSSQLKKLDSLIAASDLPAARQMVESLSQANPSPEIHHRVQNRLSEILILEGKLDEAEEVLQRLTGSSNNPFLLAETKTDLGFLFLNKGRNDIALSSLQEALDLFQRAGASGTLEAARCLAHISLVYTTTGKLSQAEENGLVALQLRQRLLGDASEEVAASYNDLGLIYTSTNPDKALEYYDKAMAVYEKLHGSEHRKIAIANNNLGFVYRQLKLYGDAVTSFETAEAIWKKIYPNGHPNQALALVNLGLTYGQMGNPTASLGYYERAVTMYKSYYGEKHSDIASVLNLLGLLKQDQGKFTESLQHFQDALCANSPTFNSKQLAQNPPSSAYYNAKVMMFTLRFKAETLEELYLGSSLRLEDMKTALLTLQTCDTLIDNIRYNSSNEGDKLEIGASANEVYEDGVRIAQTVSEASLDYKRFQKLAFYFAEKSKSAVLLESIADSEAKSFAGIPSETLEKENSMKADIALLSQKLSLKPNQEEESALRARLFNINREYQAFTKHLEENYPDYFNLKFNRAAPSIEAIQKLLGPDKAVVSYFVAEKSRRLYSFVIRQKKFHVYSSTLPADFDRLVKGFTNSIYYMAPDIYQESAGRLSALLLRGLPSVKEVVFIPSGRLGTIPFEALLYKKPGKESSFSSFPYLVQRYAVSYEFSAGLLLQKKARRTDTDKASILLCAPISFPVKDNLNDLPGTEQEVTSISKLFSGKAQVMKGQDANEGLVKSGGLDRYGFLHFATHGIVDETSPELSRIFLQSTGTEDGNVFSGEIFNLKLNADLTVLSACQTGLGKYSKGEGVIGLSRALVYAGARSIVVSYWSVADQSTAQLMTDFYSVLLSRPGVSLESALRQAKENMITKGTFAAPYYWAPFVMIGSQ